VRTADGQAKTLVLGGFFFFSDMNRREVCKSAFRASLETAKEIRCVIRLFDDMPDEKKPGVTDEDIDTSGAASGAEEGQEPDEKDVVGDGADTDTDSDIDFEAVLFAPDPDEKPDEEGGKGKTAEEGKEPDAEKGKAPAEPTLTDKLSKAKAIADQLDALPESQDANFNRLRKLNRELVQKEIDGLDAVERLAAYGDPEKIEKALALVDSLNGYDLTTMQPSSKAFVEKLNADSPDTAYNVAMNVLALTNKDGKAYAEIFTRNVLGLDPSRLADFQALSRGEVPEGYEGIVAATKEFESIPEEYHDAYKRLGPKVREIVQEGLEQFATAAEKAEAMRLLSESQEQVNKVRKDAEDAAKADDVLRGELDTKAIELENATTESIGTKVSRGLDRLAFSPDAVVNATMRSAVETRIFDLVHESSFIRGKAETYFTSVGVDMKAVRPQIDRHYKTIQDNLDVETVASVKGQKAIATQAADRRAEAERHLASIALKLVAEVAKKTKAGIAKGVNLPVGFVPDPGKRSTSSSNSGESLDWKTAAAATREGKTVGAAR
jgi:hypothetical protein